MEEFREGERERSTPRDIIIIYIITIYSYSDLNNTRISSKIIMNFPCFIIYMYLSIHLSTISIYPSIYSSVHLSTYPSIFLSIYSMLSNLLPMQAAQAPVFAKTILNRIQLRERENINEVGYLKKSY